MFKLTNGVLNFYYITEYVMVSGTMVRQDRGNNFYLSNFEVIITPVNQGNAYI